MRLSIFVVVKGGVPRKNNKQTKGKKMKNEIQKTIKDCKQKISENMKPETKEKLETVKNMGVLLAMIVIFLVVFMRSCEFINSDNFCYGTYYNPITDHIVYDVDNPVTFKDIAGDTGVCKIAHGERPYISQNNDIEVTKSQNEDGSYEVVVKGYQKDLDWIPDVLKWVFIPKSIDTYSNARPAENCVDLVINDEGTSVKCVAGTKAEEQIKAVKKQTEEIEKKSELKSTAPKDICLDNYLGAKYKDGKCEFPVKTEPMYGRAGVEKKFPSCQINKIIAGKDNTATVHAVCNGVPSIINIKRYYQKGR